MALALEGIKVIDVSQVAAVPMCARHLADFGADVIHVENPVTGDSWRVFQASQAEAKAAAPSSINYNWETYNRNKRGITLDLSQEAGRKVMYRLVEQADVFVTNLRPYEMERFGLTYATLKEINPRLVYGSVSGYGKTGPDRELPAYDVTGYWVRTGIPSAFSIPGVPSTGYRPAFGDNLVALSLALGVMIALFVRERTGLGQEVDTSLFHNGMYQLSFDINGALASGLDFDDWRETPPEDVVQQSLMAVMQVGLFYAARAQNPLAAAYFTKDSRRVFFLSLQPDRYWRKFCLAIGRQDLADDPRYQTTEGRAEHNIALRQTIGETFLTKTYAEWVPLLEGLPYAPSQTVKEAVNDPQAEVSGCFVEYEHPAYGKLKTLANPINLSDTPAAVRLPAPEWGQHTEEVLLEFGYDWDDIIALKEKGVIA
jgi:crotonobetainyl-CoA:carnitine CoA-transferase CaiB-like acyl-CoA transferase